MRHSAFGGSLHPTNKAAATTLAETRFSAGDIEGALAAYQTARDFFEAVGALLGQGNTWRDEAEILAETSVDTIDGFFEINARMLVDEPEKVSQALFEAGLGLRRLQPSRAELESLFLELSKGGAS